MSISATAKSKFYVGPSSNADLILAGFEALTFVEVGEVEDLGEWGAEGKEVTFVGLADGYTRRLKGSVDSGSVELICARDALDAGQSAMRAAAESWDAFTFKVVLNDAPTDEGTPTTFFFRGPVLSAKNSFGTADDVTKTTFTIGITGQILEVPAAEED